KAQLEKFLDFKATENPAELVNNYDWIKGMETLDFLREVGKHITISYMQAKDSVKSRMESGLSYTEFSYQLIQGYDFYYLWKHKNCKLQMGGSDQWGNIVTGTELIRRKEGGEAFALTCPLVTKADGGKFGKTEEGNVWLDPKRTSPYKFYQFWLNVSDDDAAGYIRVFTLLSKMEIEALEKEHAAAPHERALQKALAKDVTVRVHSEEDWKTAVDASQILFGKTTADALKSLPEKTLLEVFDGVPQASIVKSEMEAGIGIVDLLSGQTKFLSSKGEARRALKENSISVNKQKVGEDSIVGSSDLLNNRYVLLQKGKKNYFLVKMV
ncbi:tyrosine--tRNA ligase, partial [Bacteroidales bacterium AH-315-I05]|nr:tyrosine--tRNA ligase [Bacteroidales bacterium AH-315-I05]